MLTFYWDNLCSNLAEVYIVILENCLKRTKIQEDEARDGPFKKYLTLISFFLKKWAIHGLFFIYFRLFKQTLQFLQQIYVENVMYIQYMVPGFEPMTFETQVSCHNH